MSGAKRPLPIVGLPDTFGGRARLQRGAAAAREEEDADGGWYSSSSDEDASSRAKADPARAQQRGTHSTDTYAELSSHRTGHEGAAEGNEEDDDDNDDEAANGEDGKEGPDASSSYLDDEASADRDELIRSRISVAQSQMRDILAALSPEQLQRYETFRRIGFPRPAIKKIILRTLESFGGKEAKVLPGSINPSTVIVIASIAKVFAGELVEDARAILEEWGDDPMSPLMPAHVMEAMRRRRGTGHHSASPSYRTQQSLL